MAEEPGRFDTVKEAAGGRFERMRLFLSEVRNELKRVTWPSQKEVYATTVVVILTSIFLKEKPLVIPEPLSFHV